MPDVHIEVKAGLGRAGDGVRSGMYKSGLAYESKRIHAAAVYCSDGRIGEHFDDFLHNGLHLPRYDRVALPGGPGCLAGHIEARLEEEGVIDELKFLVDAHELERVVLIQHEGCAFYHRRLGVEPERMEMLQRADLVRAAFHIRRVSSHLQIDAYLASLAGDGLVFEPVSLE
ncbi:MAG: hypothetical protein DYG94_00500 [Leptolyngbya sp. PLA3]|nr:MAG: hypothetical protein EDM82_01375 [Cyanobacteria bacterium CYA]MCE7967215.1 hypothetical protein [Leptolyngbya sp. PL-A3]